MDVTPEPMDAVFSALQFLKAPAPIVTTESGMDTFLSVMQSLNAFSEMDVT